MSNDVRKSNLKLVAFLLFAFALIAAGFYLTKGLYAPFVVPAEYKGSSVLLIIQDSSLNGDLPELPLNRIYEEAGYRSARYLLTDNRSHEEAERWLRENSSSKFFLCIQDARNQAPKNDSPSQNLNDFLRDLNGIHSLEKSLFVVTTGSVVYIRTPDGKDISIKELNRSDLAPTILDLTGIPIPSYVKGKSLIPKIDHR